jgi:hypothetical protein
LEEQIVLRKASASDSSFIFATLLRGLYYGSEHHKEMDKRAFFEAYDKVLKHILSKPALNAKVACLASDNDVIVGYALLEPQVLHWVYVKDAWRKRGVARQLLASESVAAVTHITKVGNEIRKRKNWVYNPFKI